MKDPKAKKKTAPTGWRKAWMALLDMANAPQPPVQNRAPKLRTR